MDPANHWQPVTMEYQLELAPPAEARSGRRKKINLTAARRDLQRAARELPVGITCVSWFYILAAIAYFAFGSVLLSYPSSQVAALLISQSRILVPFPMSGTYGVPPDNMLAEALFVMAMASGAIGVLWLLRYRPVRWITLCYAGGSLICYACYFYFLKDHGAAHVGALTLRQTQAWMAASVLDALIFFYVAFYSGVGRVFKDTQ